MSFSPTGQLEWLRDLGDSWVSARHSMAIDGSGAVVVGRSGRLTGPKGDQRYDLVKLHSTDGDILWTRPLPPEVSLSSVAIVTWDGVPDCIVLGGSTLPIPAFDGVPVAAHGRDMLVAVVSPSGILRWVRTFGGAEPRDGLPRFGPVRRGAGPPTGVPDHDTVLDLAVSPTDDVAVLGVFSFDLTFGNVTHTRRPGDQSMVGVISHTGVPLWSVALGDAPPDPTGALLFSGDQLVLLQGGRLSSFSNGHIGWMASAFTAPNEVAFPALLGGLSNGRSVVGGTFADAAAVAAGTPQASEEVGAVLNLTRERIRQVEVRGLTRVETPQNSVPTALTTTANDAVVMTTRTAVAGSVEQATILTSYRN